MLATHCHLKIMHQYQHSLKRVIPNENFQVILEFSNAERRIFDMAILCREKGWNKLAYPQHIKNFHMSDDSVVWAEGGKIGANYLYEKSRPIAQASLENQDIRLGYKNQAPTSEDKFHHVYGVFLAPFSTKPFRTEESIGGGHAERGGGNSRSISELMAWPEWREHLMLSGCSWAVPLIESWAEQPEQLLNLLVSEACTRNGLPEIA